MLNDQLLEDFISSFYGYGTYQAPYWFIGMEEGGGNTIAEISKRLEVWDKRGRKELEDVAQYSREIGVTHFFGDRARLQTTWNKLIRVVLTAKNLKFDTETVREYQKSSLGTTDGDTCLLELFPLPSPSTSMWQYGENSKLSYLLNRETYREHVVSSRITHLQNRIKSYQPTAVIFYGLQYQSYWEEIVGIKFQAKFAESVSWETNGRTLFVVAKHPAAKGVTNEYFHLIGKLIVDQAIPR